ncbi:MAG: hypothetical protein HeimC2_16820 [Candidatus Heimdallarchaeota archaeon LC_2]|nr:MAG: hypothetical protein HeimC2_16820 [Candidatus Heimdallarchaeota archaeon LC_2]
MSLLFIINLNQDLAFHLMDGIISKSSILIDKEFISILVNYIHSFKHVENDKTKFQIANISIQGSQISIYRSGIVVYDEITHLVSLIEEFFNINNQELPQDLNKSKELLESRSKIEVKQKEKYTQSFWLSDSQIRRFIQDLKISNFNIEVDHSAKIMYRICDSEDNCLFINSNNIVTTNSSQVYFPYIKNVITTQPIDTGFDLYLGIESIGLYSQIGPIIITIFGITSYQSIKFQSMGVKHAELGRNLEIEKFHSLIFREFQLKKTIQINPQEFNQEKPGWDINNVLVHFLDEVKEKLQGSPNTILHVDKKLQFINSDLLRIFPDVKVKFTNKTMSSAAASIFNRIEFDNWIDEMSNKYSLKMIKSNLNEINNLEDREKLVKIKYVKNKKRNENSKF